MTRFFHQLATSLQAISRNPMRATLTILGIIIGIASVIVMMEIGAGSTRQIQERMTALGADTLTIRPTSTSVSGISSGAGSRVTLTPADVDAILRECSSVNFAAPVVQARAQAIAGNVNWNPSQIIGTTPAYLNIRAWDQLKSGTPFTLDDVATARPVCLIGATLARQLFPNSSDPVGESLRLANVNFRVIGVLKSKGSSMMGWDQDDILVAPWTSIKFRVSGSGSAAGSSSASASSATAGNQSRSNSDLYPATAVDYYPPQSSTRSNAPNPRRFRDISQIQVKLFNPNDSADAIDEITAVLRNQHRLAKDKPDDFEIRDMAEIAKMMNSTTQTMTTLLLCVAMISLVVGGVGIMNIMLVSVTERTREIGLRMAVGARPVDIMRQFLTESILLCLIGGALGIALGRGGSLIIASALRWPIEASPSAIILAVSVSASIGIVFGWYPAWKASRLNPIDALRHE